MTDNKDQIISKIIHKLDFLVLDPKKNIGEVVSHSLDSLGVKKEKVNIVHSQNEAITLLKEKKPQYLACYVDPRSKEVFGLIDEHQKAYPNKFERFFFLFSSNKSIYTFAQALEEEIDDYIVEPYTQSKLLQKIPKAVLNKQNPTNYQLFLNEVSNFIKAKDYNNARDKAQEALALHPRPAMAFYFLARIYFEGEYYDEAIKMCLQGLRLNKQHYRCLMLLHDIYFKQSDYQRAYKVLKKIFEVFPLSMVRIFDIFRLAIIEKEFKELKTYCSEILDYEDESISIVRFCTAGLAICAINYLNSKDEVNGTELLNKALKYSQNDAKILRNLYKTFINYGLQNSSEEVFAKFKFEDKESLEWEVCKYIREIFSSKPVDMIIDEARERFELVQYDEDCIRHLKLRANKEASESHLLKLDQILRQFHLEETNG